MDNGSFETAFATALLCAMLLRSINAEIILILSEWQVCHCGITYKHDEK